MSETGTAGLDQLTAGSMAREFGLQQEGLALLMIPGLHRR